MAETPFALRGEYITLGQLLKATGRVGSGSEVREFLASADIRVNDEPEARRGRKLRVGDRVRFADGEIIAVQ